MKRLKYLAMAALVAFAACDEGDEVVTTPPPVTGSVTGQVTIDGAPASGVTVTLSGAATATAQTNASGQYTFADVLAGSYTVSIGAIAEVTFETREKAAVIQSTGQTVVANFTGNYIRTSSVFGSVTAGGNGLGGVTVSIARAGGSTTVATTAANGTYSASNLRSGSYTVTISGYDQSQYQFTATSQTVTLGLGEAKAANFSGNRVASAVIYGTVLIDNAPVAGVTVTVDGKTDDTDAQGRYTIGSLLPGTYTVTLSNLPADAVFASTSASATVTSSGQQVAVDFLNGAYVGTGTISGSVISDDMGGLSGVTVTLSGGPTTGTATTNANGFYQFSGVRVGTYTATISGFDANRYQITGGTAKTGIAIATSGASSTGNDFAAEVYKTATISGTLFVDEGTKNDMWESASEPKLAANGIIVTLTGGDVADTRVDTVTTADAGVFTFANLAPGNYRVDVNNAAGVPANYVFGGTSTSVLLSGSTALAVGGTQTVNFPYDIQSQTVVVDAMLGADENNSGFPAAFKPASRVAPLAGVAITLYDTYTNATNGGTTGVLGTASTTTNASGKASFTFLRSADLAPQTGTDNIVFARLANVPANHVVNGETILEIRYDATTATYTGLDAFDFTRTNIAFDVLAETIADSVLRAWPVEIYRSVGTIAQADTTAGNQIATQNTLAAGTNAGKVFNYTEAGQAVGLNFGAFPQNYRPQTYYLRITRGGGAWSSGHGYSVTPEPTAVSGGVNDFIRVTFDGTATGKLDAGALRARYTDATIYAGAYHEVDETAGATSGDNLVGVESIAAELRNSTGTTVVRGAVAALPAGDPNSPGMFPAFQNVPTGTASANASYQLRARPGVPTQNVLVTDSIRMVTLTGADSAVVVGATTTGPVQAGSFGHKYNNTTFTGSVLAADGTTADGVIVTLTPSTPNIGGSSMRTDTVGAAGGNAAGQYAFNGIVEGKYTVSVADFSNTTGLLWKFEVTIPGNLNAASDTATVRNSATNNTSNFQPRHQQTRIRGTVVNDRDGDGNQLDPNEALAGATIEAIEDLDNDGVVDTNETVKQTATTDANGAYSFTLLPEGNYLIRGTNPGSTTLVLRSVSGTGTINNLIPVTTTASTTSVGSTTSFPAWNYDASTVGGTSQATDFTFLFANTQIVATFQTAAPAAVANMTVTVRKCVTNAGSTSPPSAGTCSTYDTTFGVGGQQNPVTNASGQINLTGLREGVYEVTPNPVTAGFTNSNPASALFRLVDTQDIENRTFTIS